MHVGIGGPLDLQATLDGGQAFRWREHADGWWTGPLGQDVVRLRIVDANSSVGLEVESGLNQDDSLWPRLHSYLGLDTDSDLIRLAFDSEPHLIHSLSLAPGLRLLRQDPWESLASFILSAQCHIPRIKRNVEALSQAAGKEATVWGGNWYLFPGPEAVLSLGEARLRKLGIGFRAPNLVATAAAIADGVVDLEALRSQPYLEARDTLMNLPGVGPKIADCVLAFSLDHGEAFPVDRWVTRSLERLYFRGRRMNNEKAAAWARRRFGAYATYAQQLLFHVERSQALETKPLPGSRAAQAARSPQRAIV